MFPKSRIFFDHVKNTGGTSLHGAFERLFPGSSIAFITEDITIRAIPGMLERFDIVCAHGNYDGPVEKPSNAQESPHFENSRFRGFLPHVRGKRSARTSDFDTCATFFSPNRTVEIVI